MTRPVMLSLYDKTGLVEFAPGLARLGFEQVASVGTAACCVLRVGVS